MTKYIIYKEGDKIKGTSADNYHARIQNAFNISTFEDFKSLQQAKEYIIKYSNLKDDEVTILDENISY